MIEILGHLADGFWLSIQPVNLALILIGVTLGLFIGAMPGLGSVNGVAILLPITFLVPPASAIIFGRTMRDCSDIADIPSPPNSIME